MSNKIVEFKSKNLAAELGNDAILALQNQRDALKRFIKTQLVRNIDYGMIPGTNKDTLFQPGAQKLANIFQLASTIVESKTDIDHGEKFVMSTYRVQLNHLPTGKVISQCEGSVNSKEKKYLRQDPYSIINTLQRMAQKRAFVGAVIQACNASDFFTQDLEDMDKDVIATERTQEKFETNQRAVENVEHEKKLDEVINPKLTEYRPEFSGMTWRQAGKHDPELFCEFAQGLYNSAKNRKKPTQWTKGNLAWAEYALEYGQECYAEKASDRKD